MNGQWFQLGGIYKALCQFLAPWWNSPLDRPIPVPRSLLQSIQAAILEIKQYWENRYSEMLLKSTNSLMEQLSRRVLLDQYGRFLEGSLKRLTQLEEYLLVDAAAQIMIPCGQLRNNKWRLLGYLNYRSAFG